MVKRAALLWALAAALLGAPLSAENPAPAGVPVSAGAPVPVSAGAASAAAPLSATAKAGHAKNLSNTASQDLPLLPPSPKIPPLKNPPAWETFTVVTLLSAPFTALWCGLLAGLAESIVQRRIPPKFGTPQYELVGTAAIGCSLSIALISLDWGSSKPKTTDAAGSGKEAPSPCPPRPAPLRQAPVPEAAARRALITGVGGFLGSNLAQHLMRAGWTVWGTWHTLETGPKTPAALTLRHLDVCVPDHVRAVLDEAQPDTIFHLAALADPDSCAQDEAAARQINVQGTKTLALQAQARGARMVFLSTDQVFDGSKALSDEDDAPAPLGAYGRSKRDAETAVREAGGAHLILRLALTYGWGRGTAKGRNFAEQWLRSFLTGNRVRAFTDQWRTPIYGEDACEALRLGAENGWSGTLHLAGPQRVTRFDFGVRLAREFGFPPESVLASELKDVVFRDPRPSDASLDTRKLRSLGFQPRGLDEGLKAMHQELERL